MSSKISALTSKNALDDSDSFVIVDSVGLDNKKINALSIDQRNYIPSQVIDPARCIAPFPLISNGQSPSAAITLAERNFLVFPIFIASTINVTHIGLRSSSTGSPAFDVEYGIYTHEQGLPTSKIISQAFSLPALGGSEFNEQALSSPLTLKRGVYWLAVLNKTGVTASLSSASPNNNLFGQLTGSSSDISGNDPRCFSSVVPLAENELPSSLVSRSVDFRTTTASQTTLRLRVSVAITYLRYTI